MGSINPAPLPEKPSDVVDVPTAADIAADAAAAAAAAAPGTPSSRRSRRRRSNGRPTLGGLLPKRPQHVVGAAPPPTQGLIWGGYRRAHPRP